MRIRREISSEDYTPTSRAYQIVVAGGLALAGAFIAYVLLG
jgi:hypothetical protein